MANTKHEDAIMKMGIDYFRDTILKNFGIDYSYIDTGPTELIELSIHSLYMDFTFLTTENMYVHIEFQTTDHGEYDLRRFNAYSAVLQHRTGRKVITYVIYSGGIRQTRSELDCGMHKYRVHPIYMKDWDADAIIAQLKYKREHNEPLVEKDFPQLALTPLMASVHGKKDIIREALLLAKTSDNDTAEKTIAMLYALADKFLDSIELKEIREVVAMTRLGQMIYDDGVEKGIQQGIEKGIEQGIEKGIVQGIEKGIEQGTEQMSLLTKKLLAEERLDDLKRAIEDKAFREELMKAFGLD